MGKKYLASVAEVELFEKVDGALRLFASAHTLTDSAMSFSNSMEEVRGGQGGKLYGRFGHTSGITLQMTDIIVNMNYFLNNIYTIQSILCTIKNEIKSFK